VDVPGEDSEPIDLMRPERADHGETISGGSSGGRGVTVAALLVGALIGAAGIHYFDGRQAVPSAPVAEHALDVRASLGAYAGDLSVVGDAPVVAIPLVITNATSQPLTLSAILASGPGASMVPDPGGRPVQELPTTLASGQPLDTRIAIRSDCAVPVRPPPIITLVLQDQRGHVRDLVASIPDLDNIWGQTLIAPACGLK
jgi:hypothetical protein